MPAERKISDEDVARLRDLAENGSSRDELAEAFGISREHVGRLVRGDARPLLDPPAAIPSAGVSDAIELFLGSHELRGDRAGVLAAMARALATKIDAASSSTASASAQALPRLTAQMVEVLRELQDLVPREPDALDLLQERFRQDRVDRGWDY